MAYAYKFYILNTSYNSLYTLLLPAQAFINNIYIKITPLSLLDHNSHLKNYYSFL